MSFGKLVLYTFYPRHVILDVFSLQTLKLETHIFRNSNGDFGKKVIFKPYYVRNKEIQTLL